MPERDRFDLTRGGEEDEDGSARVSSLRRRGRPGPPPGARAQNLPHREFVARVKVPVTITPAPSAAAALHTQPDWNEAEAAELHETSRSQQSRQAVPLRRILVVALAVLLTLAIALAILHVHDGAAGSSAMQRQRVALSRSLAEALTPGLASIAAEVRRIAKDAPAAHHRARARHTLLRSPHKLPVHGTAPRTTPGATAPATAAADQSSIQPTSTPAVETRQPAAESAGSHPSTASSSKTSAGAPASNPLGGIGSCIKGCS
jgi:hypothetical protein